MRKRQCYLTAGLSVALVCAGITAAAPASADCTDAGAATVCAQGEVRGGGPTAPIAGPAYPSYCADPWYCDDGWNLDVIIDPGPPGGGIGPRPPGGGIDIGRPGRPGGGGGIGPR